MKSTSSLGAVLAAFAGLSLLTATAHADVTIGVTLPLSGAGASLGQPSKLGLALWPQEIAGQKLRVVLLDDVGDPTNGTKNARRFAEDNVDLIVGSVVTPASLAVTQVANEIHIPQLSMAPVEPSDGKDAWTFRLVMPQAFYVEGIVEHMKKAGVKTVGFLGWSDAFGESVLQALNKQAVAAGLTVTSVERFMRNDSSVTSQALKVVAGRPDAVLVVASGGGAALPQKALMERGYKGKVYHTAASVAPDFIRLAGPDAEGVLAISGPEQVPEQLPDTHSARQQGLDFINRFEKINGPGSRTQFAAHLYDVSQILAKIVPVALKTARPGTAEFRLALKNALETVGEVQTSKGSLRYSATNHWGYGPSARVMLVVQGGDWKFAR